jgi:hypothetical protein
MAFFSAMRLSKCRRLRGEDRPGTDVPPDGTTFRDLRPNYPCGGTGANAGERTVLAQERRRCRHAADYNSALFVQNSAKFEKPEGMSQ